MNPFTTLQHVQSAYRTYVHTFQKFNNPAIQDWVAERVEQGTLLWRDPFIQLSRPFETGKALNQLVSEGLLHPHTPSCFTADAGNRRAPPIHPHQHQSDAIRNILTGHNTVIATGTGSGKSFCFGIPIVSECLRLRRQNVPGIKAVIIYPMNALANSQYDDFARRLAGSGLKLALYAGDTFTNPEQALEAFREVTGRDQPSDSEIISREEIRTTPPDILMTNYVMLELLLTRFEDRILFPPGLGGVLRFLVLDEVHTYTGKRGADVACLIRRLKQHTQTTGNLRCIATSATVQAGPGADGEGEDANALIADFCTRLFGEPFTPQHVIAETYAPLSADLSPLTCTTAEAVADGPRSLYQLARDLNLSPEEIQQALLPDSLVPDFPTLKLHAFFSQGRSLTSCLTREGPHLNDRGELTCPECGAHFRRERLTFPLNFCRACGQEFYGVAVQEDGSLTPRDINATDYKGHPAYVYPVPHDARAVPYPDNWLTDAGNISSRYAEAVPQNRTYCPVCNRLDPECDHDETLSVAVVAEPLLLSARMPGR